MAVQTAARRAVKHELPRDALGRLILDSYARMSDGFEGKEINVADQFQTCDQLIASRGHVLGERFDDPLSAWKRDVKRPGWNTIIERMKSGITAGVVIYNIDRFLRQNRQLEELLDTVEGLGCVVLSPGSEYDLDNEEHRMALRMQVTFANKSSADTRRRVKAKLAAMRERGILPGGGPRPFAWPGLEPLQPGHKKRKPVSEDRLAAECDALVRAFNDVLRGKALSTIAVEWNEAGLLSFYGNPWDGTTVRNTMSRGRHAGHIEHEGEVVGAIADHEPTIDPVVFAQVQMKFASRRRGAPASKRYLAAGIVCCAVCGQTMQSRPRYPGGDSKRKDEAIPTYRCIKRANTLRCGSVQIDQVHVDEFLRTLVIARLSDPTVAQAASEVVLEADIRGIELTAELETAIATRESLLEKVAMGEIPQASFDKISPKLAERIRVLEVQVAQVTAVASDQERVRAESEAAVAARWDEGGTEVQRAMLLSATRLVRVEIHPVGRGNPRGGRVPPAERCQVVPL